MKADIIFQHTLREMVFSNVSGEVWGIVAVVTFFVIIFSLAGLIISAVSEAEERTIIGLIITLVSAVFFLLLIFFNIYIVIVLVLTIAAALVYQHLDYEGKIDEWKKRIKCSIN